MRRTPRQLPALRAEATGQSVSSDASRLSCFLFRPRRSCEKRRKRSHTNVSMHRSYELQGSLKRRRKHPHPTSINGHHTVKMVLAQSSTNGPRSLSFTKAGTHSAFRERSHTRAHAPKQGAFLSADTAWLCVASEIVTERTAGGSGCTPMACVRFLRRRGPAGLRDLIISLPTLRSLTFHVEFSYHTNRLVPPLSACTARC